MRSLNKTEHVTSTAYFFYNNLLHPENSPWWYCHFFPVIHFWNIG